MIKKRDILLFSAFSLLSLGCSTSDQKDLEKELTQDVFSDQNLFTNHFVMDSEFYQLSFPNWFSPAVITKNKIATIALKDYSVDSSYTEGRYLTSEQIISFNKRGRVDSLTLKNYYQNKLMEQLVFVYSSLEDSSSYSLPLKVNRQSVINLPTEEDVQLRSSNNHTIAELEAKNNTQGTLLFKPQGPSFEGAQYLFILDESKQNISFVDQWQEQNGEATITYGSPSKPLKRFKVENMVNKSQQEQFFYSSDDNHLIKLELRNDFSQKTTRVNYDESGLIRDLFFQNEDTEGRTIECKKWLIKYHVNGLPDQLVLKQGADSTDLSISQRRILSYRYRKNDF